ncbi:N-terminal acetyltransferase, putative [Candida dubliniensis CD36]|uniref:N-terminal peptidyl-methionine acetyltransferase, putative n=1 Tax=Candida dubliniensis (strain CD36 / ATCC MYA-646 / CBS 7987 / NCPF 3949 / NRRL Y-17841) TaxID=573826 RepID=B9WA73_CANDC|nr:N-terminal acetyltransferase, putative [Candida dubliniensis CD36]CAX43292.1 N-terminal acetyltransferase, putative [Candida dubliniensis CD36]
MFLFKGFGVAFRPINNGIFRSFRFQSTRIPPNKKPQGIKALMKEYGYPALAVYLGLSCIDLPICYVLVHSMGQEKIEVYENKVKQTFGYGVSDEELKKKQEINKIQQDIESHGEPAPENSGSMASYILSQFSWTEFAIAYGIHKSLIFIRLPITAAITPGVVRVLRGWGFRIGTDKFSTTASIAKDLAKSGIKDITASSTKFGVKAGNKKWWWFF